MVITPDQMRLLEELLGPEGHLILGVSEALEINRATKVLYLQRAVQQSRDAFNISLDELNGFYTKTSTERLNVIRSLKTINDLYHNSRIEYIAEGPEISGIPRFLTDHHSIRQQLNHTFGFDIKPEIRFIEETGDALKKAFQPLIYRKVQDEINILYTTYNHNNFMLQRRNARLDAHKIKTDSKWREELSLTSDQRLNSPGNERECNCGGRVCGNPSLIFFILNQAFGYSTGRAGDEFRDSQSYRA